MRWCRAKSNEAFGGDASIPNESIRMASSDHWQCHVEAICQFGDVANSSTLPMILSSTFGANGPGSEPHSMAPPAS